MAHPPSIKPAFQLNLRKLNFWLFFLVVVAAVGYFLTANELSTKGFAFKDLKAEYNQLVIEKQKTENTITALASYQSLQPRIQSLRFVATDSVSYLSWDDNMVAKR